MAYAQASAASAGKRQHVSAEISVDTNQRVHVRLCCTPAGSAMQVGQLAHSVSSIGSDVGPGHEAIRDSQSVDLHPQQSLCTEQSADMEQQPPRSSLCHGSAESDALSALADDSLSRRGTGSTRSVAGRSRSCSSIVPSNTGDSNSPRTSTIGEDPKSFQGRHQVLKRAVGLATTGLDNGAITCCAISCAAELACHHLM